MRATTGFRAPLVDVLIGAILLVVLAATVVPLAFAQEGDPRDVLTALDLEILRSQIETYRIQHDGRYPGASGTADEFRRHLLTRTDRTGSPAAAENGSFGPYFAERLPANSWTGGRGVLIVDDVDAARTDPGTKDRGEAIGWVYSPKQGRVKASGQQSAISGQP